MKCCSLCKIDKIKSAFNKRKSSKDGLQNVCRECNRLKAKKYYSENQDKHKQTIYERKIKIKIRNQKLVFEYLMKHPCMDCGETNPLTLEFDHLNDKRKEVSFLLANGYSWRILKREIEKCEVRCASCHAIKTHKENNSYKHKLYEEYGLQALR